MSKTLNYKIQKAPQYPKKSGVIFLIHGYGSNSDDLFSFKTYLPKNLSIISLEAPIELEMGGFAWYSINYNQDFKKWSNDKEAMSSIKKIYQTINILLKKYNLPILLWDERFSTIGILREMKKAKIKKETIEKNIDAASATWILQSALDTINNSLVENHAK